MTKMIEEVNLEQCRKVSIHFHQSSASNTKFIFMADKVTLKKWRITFEYSEDC